MRTPTPWPAGEPPRRPRGDDEDQVGLFAPDTVQAPSHALTEAGYDKSSGALWVRCRCGHEDRVFPPPDDYTTVQREEGAQLERFKAHLRASGPA